MGGRALKNNLFPGSPPRRRGPLPGAGSSARRHLREEAGPPPRRERAGQGSPEARGGPRGGCPELVPLPRPAREQPARGGASQRRPMGARPAQATGHLGMLIQRAGQWAHAGGGPARRGRGRSQLRGRAARAAADPGRGSAARPARPGLGPRPERPPSPLQPRRPAGGPWRPSAPRHPARAAGAPRPGPPARTPRPRPCRCPRRRRYRAPGAGRQSTLPAKMASGLHKLWAPGGGRAARACPRGWAGSLGALDAGCGAGAGRANRSRFGGCRADPG